MNEIQYIGENLLPRQIGHAGVVLSFVSALLATIAYALHTHKSQSPTPNPQNTEGWLKLGRWSFGVHFVAVCTVIASIFYVMINKRFEYFYAHSHVDNDLPFQYVFAAFWEGQEGSFLLWMFWHVVLGGFLILKYAKNTTLNPQPSTLNPQSPTLTWESPTLATLASVQVFLGSMILGLHFGWGESLIKWGSNPILLLRETTDAPVFAQADYVAKIANSAKGLNPLLQNYWMTIHPPTLFLGFASTTIPFCFAIAGLWTKRYNEWLKPALPWALFSGAILGTGILMGGAWAYEALSFNGYWAWDPVENMSLVPWIVLVAGIHTHLIAKSTGHSIRATFAFYILTFLLVLYSTFLTRSGILGDTSAHAFTEMGLEWQLVLLQGFFVAISAWFFIKNYKKIETPTQEESIASREFWMFIGSLVLMLSVVLISFTTSIPVFNKILEFFNPSVKKLSAPVDVVGHYNRTQVWIGIFMGLLSAGAQFLRFKEFNFKGWKETFLKHLAISGGLSVGLTLLLLGWIEAATNWQLVLFLFAGVFTVVSNLDYALVFLRNNLKASGSAVSHVGFGVLLVGILASGVNKNWISHNRFAMEGLGLSEEQLGKNILLIKGLPMMMNGYQVAYESDTTIGLRRDFTLKFRKMNKELTAAVDSFTTHPYLLYAKKTGKIASTNPDTRHYVTFDVFSHIAALPPTEQDPEIAREREDSLNYRTFDVALGEKVTVDVASEKLKKLTPQYQVEVLGINTEPKHPKYQKEEGDVPLGVKIRVSAGQDSVYEAEPLVLLRGDDIYQLPSNINPFGLRVKPNPEIFDRLFQQQKDLKFTEYQFLQGQTQQIGNNDVTFESVDVKPKVDNFEMKEGDLAFAANLKVVNRTTKAAYSAKPIFVIRGNQPIPIKDQVSELNLNFVIQKVTPETKKVHIGVASTPPLKMPISIAEEADRNDYIVLEATINPGINLVWLGSILMVLGLSVAMFYRLKR
jgi:cytochrome c-type biogenesis protein CcmF